MTHEPPVPSLERAFEVVADLGPLECAAHPESERAVYLASYIREANRVRYVAYRVT